MVRRKPVPLTIGQRLRKHRRSLLALSAIVATLAAAYVVWWTVQAVAIRPPVPDLQVAGNQQIVDFMAHPQGLERLSLPDREAFIVELVRTCAEPLRRRDLVRRIRQMSSGERVEIREALVHTVRDRIVEDSKEYQRVEGAAFREEFVNQRMGNYARLQKSLKGKAPEENILLTLDERLPQNTEGWTKYFLSRTRPTERALAKPFLDHVEQRIRELNDSDYERERFERQYVGSG